MKLRLIAVGDRLPAWAQQATQEFARRLPREWRFELVEVAAATRSAKADAGRSRRAEGEKLLRAVPAGARLVAFDERGEALGTAEWAAALGRWQQEGRDLAFLIGGADGLAADCLQRAERRWALSKLTLPHALARVVAVEQLYRASTVLAGHPYHRA